MSSKSWRVTGADETLPQILLETLPDGICAVDEDGILRICNHACDTLFQFQPGELSGKTIEALVPAELQKDGYSFPRSFELASSDDGPAVYLDLVGKKKDQSTFLLRAIVRKTSFAGRPIFVALMHGSIDRGHDRNLQESETRTRSILETVPDAVVTVDEEGIVEEFSSAASTIFGYESAEVVGKNLRVLIPPFRGAKDDDHEDLFAGLGQNAATKSHVVIGQRQNGSVFPMEVSVGEIRGDKARLFTVFVRDLTKRQGTAERMENLQAELLHASRVGLMGQMTAAIAHEINQPLAAIANYVRAANRILESTDRNVDTVERARVFIDKAAVQTVRAGKIVRRLRDFTEKRERRRAPEYLNKIVPEALALAMVGTDDQDIKVRLDLDAALGPVTIDKIQIQQVLINLIRNSIEAMRSVKNRVLTIKTESGEEGFAEITVGDTGPGLPQNVAKQLFTPFVTTKITGMGIGLSVARSIVGQHGGSLWLQDSTSQGTKFRFRLPLAHVESSGESDKPKVIVVDDDTDMRESLRALLESAGYAVRDFPSASAFLQSRDYSGVCLIVDVRMPGMDGLELQRELITRGIGLPVIVMTGHGDISLAVKAMKAGAVDFIEKPFDDQSMLDGITKAREIGPSGRATRAGVAAAQKLIDTLTPREKTVLKKIVDGLSNKAAAHELGISPRTVEIHRARIMEKMGAESLSTLVRVALAAEQQPASMA